ncbi:lipopolysaccharide biosynthesis protein [Mycolicibacterium litorale]|uniref:lipopolysaccharide biosynthesis protein n=1 Tax=Mycolicibacterium litorale TaxID=758802 RepID=UPI0039A02621
MTAAVGAATSEMRRSFGWRTAAAAAGLLCTLLLTVAVYRMLDARDAAVFFAILAALSIGPLVGRLGLGPNVIRLVAAEPGRLGRRAIASSHLRATGVLSLLSAPLIALPATWALHDSADHLPVALLTAAAIVAESLRLTLSDVFAATGRVGASVATTHHIRSMVVLPVVGAIALAVSDPTLLDVMVSYTVVSVVHLAAALVFARRDIGWRTGGGVSTLAAALSAGARLFTLDLAAFLCLPGTVWLANAVFAPQQAALYSAAATLALQVTVVESLAALAVTPAAARLWAAGDHEQVVRVLSAVATLSTAVTVGAVGVLAAFGAQLLGFAYGPSMREAAGLLVVMAAGGIAKTALGVNITLLVISGHITKAARTALVVLTVSVPLALAAAVAGGPVWLAAASASAMTAVALAQWQGTRRVIGAAPRAGLRVSQGWQSFRHSP